MVLSHSKAEYEEQQPEITLPALAWLFLANRVTHFMVGQNTFAIRMELGCQLIMCHWVDFVLGQFVNVNNVKIKNFCCWLLRFISPYICRWKDRHITGFKWSAVGISILLVVLFIAAFIYYWLFQRNENGEKSYFNKLNFSTF